MSDGFLMHKSENSFRGTLMPYIDGKVYLGFSVIKSRLRDLLEQAHSFDYDKTNRPYKGSDKHKMTFYFPREMFQ